MVTLSLLQSIQCLSAASPASRTCTVHPMYTIRKSLLKFGTSVKRKSGFLQLPLRELRRSARGMQRPWHGVKDVEDARKVTLT